MGFSWERNQSLQNILSYKLYIHSLILDLLQHLVGHLLLFYFCWSVMIVHQQEFPFKLRLEQTVFSDIPSRNDYGRVVHVVIAHTCFVMIDRVILANTRNARKKHISLWKYHFRNRPQTCLQIINLCWPFLMNSLQFIVASTSSSLLHYWK